MAEDHPRIRGEHADIAERFPDHDGSSPHTRGARIHPRRGPHAVRIIPAYAGSTARRVAAGLPESDHPRIRGEHSDPGSRTLYLEGSSPHTRGALLGDVLMPGDGAIIPAYAGSTSDFNEATDTDPDHPRIRGEHASQ